MLCSKWLVWSQLKAITGSAVAGGSMVRMRVLVNLLSWCHGRFRTKFCCMGGGCMLQGAVGMLILPSSPGKEAQTIHCFRHIAVLSGYSPVVLQMRAGGVWVCLTSWLRGHLSCRWLFCTTLCWACMAPSRAWDSGPRLLDHVPVSSLFLP